MNKLWIIPILFAILITSSFSNAFAASDFFLKLDGIDGESTDERHNNWIEVHSYSWGVSNSGSLASGGGGGSGKASFSDLHITKTVDKSSPKLMLAVATGEHLKTLDLTLRKAGGSPMDYYIIHMEDVLVSSFSTTGSTGGPPLEEVSFTYQKITWEYIPQNSDGTAGASIKAGYDVKANVKI